MTCTREVRALGPGKAKLQQPEKPNIVGVDVGHEGKRAGGGGGWGESRESEGDTSHVDKSLPRVG